MIAFFASFFTGKAGIAAYIIAALVAVIAAMAFAAHLLLDRLEEKNRTIGAQAAQIEQAVATANENAEALRLAGLQHDRDMAAVAAELEESRSRAGRVVTVTKEVYVARPEDRQPDGCGFPAPLLRSLDGVLQLRAAEDRDQGGGAAGHNP